tara:strand:+ start:658 stop:1137 length:480 start_codon:yes stop_codon:yes gene_type:complete
MTGDNLLSIDKLEEFMNTLDSYASNIPSVEPNPDVEKLINLSSFELKSFTSEECCEKAYVLYGYCNYLQKEYNKQAAKSKWCEECINHAVSSKSHNFDKYTKWEVKVNLVIREDDFIQKVWRVKRVVDGIVTSCSETIRDIRKQADTLIELSRRKYNRG